MPLTEPTKSSAVVVREVPWDSPDAAGLRALMSEEIDPRYADHADRIGAALSPDPDEVVVTLVGYDGATPVACASLRRMPAAVDVDGAAAPFEVKKLFVAPSHRRLGLASVMLAAVTRAAVERGAAALVLHTGTRQPEAAALYEARGWHRVPVYGEYAAIADVSMSFGRRLG